jgi:hypothetical protein
MGFDLQTMSVSAIYLLDLIWQEMDTDPDANLVFDAAEYRYGELLLDFYGNLDSGLL